MMGVVEDGVVEDGAVDDLFADDGHRGRWALGTMGIADNGHRGQRRR